MSRSALIPYFPEGEGPEVGSVVFDANRGREGVVMAVGQGRINLRPKGGGCEWEALREHLRPTAGYDLGRSRVAEPGRGSNGIHTSARPEIGPVRPASDPRA